MKVKIIEEGAYPYYAIGKVKPFPHGVIVDIPREKLKWIRKVKKEYLKMHCYLSKLYDKGERE